MTRVLLNGQKYSQAQTIWFLVQFSALTKQVIVWCELSALLSFNILYNINFPFLTLYMHFFSLSLPCFFFVAVPLAANEWEAAVAPPPPAPPAADGAAPSSASWF